MATNLRSVRADDQLRWLARGSTRSRRVRAGRADLGPFRALWLTLSPDPGPLHACTQAGKFSGMAEPFSWVPAGINTDVPSAARVYDFLLGGGHNFASDRMVGEKVLGVLREGREIASSNRSFMRRAVLLMMEQGITQFLDLGSGIPTVGNVHEIVQQENPDARVVYVDYDEVAVSHSQLILEGNENAGVVQADMCRPRRRAVRPGRQGPDRLHPARRPAHGRRAALRLRREGPGRGRRPLPRRHAARQPDRPLAPDRRLQAAGDGRGRRGHAAQPRPDVLPFARRRSPPCSPAWRCSSRASSRRRTGTPNSARPEKVAPRTSTSASPASPSGTARPEPRNRCSSRCSAGCPEWSTRRGCPGTAPTAGSAPTRPTARATAARRCRCTARAGRSCRWWCRCC